ncbi:pyridoxal phosphate-dependent aminotransferase [Patulibacter sp.]|uniref:pyridoxal phosphate-dependent aminotransferase n=1 Tax=Patulibacter sp. TaxID=1912859 RepID=UPI00271C0F69|nr:aminotransferase class I/II-fold pyridoxal phosphate-dependent enzyme [Patulibacter sp.]MDO9407049.1 aminotransferase class I/II-fold pyridoxal phosphate-dependent enzyme [Patulibacter sp.]
MAASYSRNPLLRRTGTYPFQRLTEARDLAARLGEEDRAAADTAGSNGEAARSNGDAAPVVGGPPAAPASSRLIDLGAGEPREPTPKLIRRAMVAAIEEETVSAYPMSVGLPELRAAVADWIGRRYAVALDPDRHVLPTLGSKELVFTLAQVLVDVAGGRDLVGVPQPAYPVYERGARFAGGEVLDLPLHADRGFLPDLDAISDADWSRLALIWVNYPNNPTAAVASREWYRGAVARCREHGVVLASDEAYSELWFTGDAPDSALQIGAGGDDLEGVLVVNTLSKRSSMPGYRSGFVAGDAELIAALKAFRPSVGVAPQRFVQKAAVAAWQDEGHVVEVRDRYRHKLALLQPGLDALGLVDAGGPASFFRWLAVPGDWASAPWASRALADPRTAELVSILTDGDPDDRGSAAYAAALLRAGIVVAPGAFFGPAGEGYVRAALVPTAEDCAEAARRLVALTSDD